MLRKIFKDNCKHIEPLLWEYAGGQLLPEQKARVEAHLKRCIACQAQLQTVGRIGQGLETLRQAPVPATQAHWAEVQARLVSAPLLPQSAARVNRISRPRALMGVGMAAAMALLWIALIPRGGEPLLSVAKEGGKRSAKHGMSQPASETSLASAAAMNVKMAFEKSFLKARTEDASPYLTRPFAPAVRLASVGYNRIEIVSGRFRKWHGGRYVRRPRFARRHRFLLAQKETARPNQNAPASGIAGRMFAPAIGVALTLETPNYVLTGVEAEAESGRPRAYVMDCVSTNAGRQTDDASGQMGEEQAW